MSRIQRATAKKWRETNKFDEARHHVEMAWRGAQRAHALGAKRLKADRSKWVGATVTSAPLSDPLASWLAMRGFYAATAAICRDRDVPLNIATAFACEAAERLRQFTACVKETARLFDRERSNVVEMKRKR